MRKKQSKPRPNQKLKQKSRKRKFPVHFLDLDSIYVDNYRGPAS